MQNRIFKIHCSQIGKIMGASKPAGQLSVTCKTFLKEWYANEYEEIHSKYIEFKWHRIIYWKYMVNTSIIHT